MRSVSRRRVFARIPEAWRRNSSSVTSAHASAIEGCRSPSTSPAVESQSISPASTSRAASVAVMDFVSEPTCQRSPSCTDASAPLSRRPATAPSACVAMVQPTKAPGIAGFSARFAASAVVSAPAGSGRAAARKAATSGSLMPPRWHPHAGRATPTGVRLPPRRPRIEWGFHRGAGVAIWRVWNGPPGSRNGRWACPGPTRGSSF
jgi:hypothetical protein